jgi:hypothetical protein
MCFARSLMPTLADDFVAVGEHAADTGIRLRRVQAEFGQAQRARHMRVIDA